MSWNLTVGRLVRRPSAPGGKLEQFSEARRAGVTSGGEKSPAQRRAGVSWIRRTDALFRLISDLRFSSPPGIILSSNIPLKDAMNASVELPDSNLSATDPDFEQALAEVRTVALEHHRNGRMDEAESLYRMVLDARPGDADINYNMGVIVYGRGQYAEAVPYFEVAVGANPNQGQYWSSYIEALTNSGEIAAAWIVLEMAQQRGMTGPVINKLIAGITAATNAREVAEQAACAPSVSTPAPAQPVKPQPAAAAAGATAKTRLGAAAPTPQEVNRTVTLYNQGRVV